MNKKLLTTLLLCIFTLEPLCWAEEVIVGADGQARYANQKIQAQNERVVRMDNQKGQKTYDIQELSNNVEVITSEKIKELAKSYEKQNLGLIKKEKKKVSFLNFFITNNVNWGDSDISYKIPLLDGDYVTWSPSIKTRNSAQFAREFDKNDKLKGYIKIVRVDAKTIAFYEYRDDNNDNKNIYLTHVVIFYNDEHQATFVYSVNGALRSCMLDKKLYSVDLPIVPDVQQLQLGYSTLKKDNNASVKNGMNTAAAAAVIGVGAPIYSVAIAPFLLIAFAIMIPSFAIDAIKSGK